MTCTRDAMTMRATLERFTDSGGGSPRAADSWGGTDKSTPPAIINSALPCLVWIDKKSLIADGVKAGTREVVRVLFPKDADVLCGDKIVEIKNTRGDDLFLGTYEVEEISPVIAWGEKSHLESTLLKAGA